MMVGRAVGLPSRRMISSRMAPGGEQGGLISVLQADVEFHRLLGEGRDGHRAAGHVPRVELAAEDAHAEPGAVGGEVFERPGCDVADNGREEPAFGCARGVGDVGGGVAVKAPAEPERDELRAGGRGGGGGVQEKGDGSGHATCLALGVHPGEAVGHGDVHDDVGDGQSLLRGGQMLGRSTRDGRAGRLRR